jgi:hypothetical protein
MGFCAEPTIRAFVNADGWSRVVSAIQQDGVSFDETSGTIEAP